VEEHPLFDIPVKSGPLQTIASYLNPSELFSFLSVNRNLQLSSLFYKTQTIRIPADATDEAVLQMLPSLKKFEKISIGLNHDHLSFLQENCPQLRHLIVHSELRPIPLRELKPIMDSLKTFTGLTSLKIDIPHFFDVTELEDLRLPNFTILPVNIPFGLTDEAVGRLLPSLKRFESIRIGLNPGHLKILKECANLQRLSVTQFNDEDAQIEETIAQIMYQLSSFISLKSLEIELWTNGFVVDMAPIGGLTELTELMLYGFNSPDLSFASRLKNLKKLSIANARTLGSIQPIAELPQLEELDLRWNLELGSDYDSILPGMKQLKRLSLRGSWLMQQDVSWLKDMKQLLMLDIRGEYDHYVHDISSLSGLPIYSDKQKLIWHDRYYGLDPRNPPTTLNRIMRNLFQS
jgi:hypothetical protein